MDSLLQALRRPEVSVAAWRDAVAAFADPTIEPELCEAHIRTLRELAELRGHLWQPLGLASSLQSAISGSPTTLK